MNIRKIVLVIIAVWSLAIGFDAVMDVVAFKSNNVFPGTAFFTIKEGLFPAFLFDAWHMSKFIMQAIFATCIILTLRFTLGKQYSWKWIIYSYVGFGCATYIIHEMFTHLILIK